MVVVQSNIKKTLHKKVERIEIWRIKRVKQNRIFRLLGLTHKAYIFKCRKYNVCNNCVSKFIILFAIPSIFFFTSWPKDIKQRYKKIHIRRDALLWFFCCYFIRKCSKSGNNEVGIQMDFFCLFFLSSFGLGNSIHLYNYDFCSTTVILNNINY